MIYRLLVALCLCFLVTASVQARSEWSARAIVSGDKAYLIGKAENITLADVGSFYQSPDGRYLLAIRSTPPEDHLRDTLAPHTPPLPRTISLELYDAKRHHTASLWKAEDAQAETVVFGQIIWLMDSETAIVTLYRDQTSDNPPPSPAKTGPLHEADLLIVNAARHTARSITVQENQERFPLFQILPSPTRMEALLAYRSQPEGTYQLRTISSSGVMTDPITETVDFLQLSGWNADGTIAVATGRWKATEPEGKATTGWLVLDRRSRTIRHQDTAPKDISNPLSEESIRSAREANQVLHLALIQKDLSPRGTPCVYLQGATKEDNFFIAAEATPIGIMGSDPELTAIYLSADAIYAVPISVVSLSVYEQYMRTKVEANIRQINSALQQWMYDNKAAHPPLNANLISELVGPKLYMKTDSGFRDPRTGQLALSYIYNGQPDATGRIPLFSLNTSVGRGTFYYSNERDTIVWEKP